MLFSGFREGHERRAAVDGGDADGPRPFGHVERAVQPAALEHVGGDRTYQWHPGIRSGTEIG